MGSSFAIASDIYDGRYLKLECTQKSNGGAENSSTITWKLSSIGGNVKYYSTGATKVIINGTTVYSKARVAWDSEAFPASEGYVEGTVTVPHNNDGSKTITVKLSTAIYYSTVKEYSDSWTLKKIDRYAVITSYSLTAASETSVKISSSSDVDCDLLRYSINGGEWKDGPYYNSTITGLSPNTTYNIKIALKSKASQLWTYSDDKKVTTYDYPHCTSAPDFVIGNELTLKFYNPLKRTYSFTIVGNGKEIHTWTGRTGETYSGVDGDPAVPNLYASIPNAKSAKYSVKVVYGSSTKTQQGGTYSVDESKCIPTFTTFTYKDTNATVTTVTGNNKVLVKGLSNLSVDIATANKMVAKNSATPDYYSANIDTLNVSKAYSATATVTIPVGVVASAGTKRLNVRAYDSRGISKLAYQDVIVYDYAKPKLSISASRLNNFEATTTIKVSGEYTRLTIGGADKNTIKSVEYRAREKGGTWPSTYTTISTTLSAGKITCSDVTLSLDNTKAWEIEVKATDNLSSNTAIATVDVGEAIFFISTNKRKCYINSDEIVWRQDYTPNGDAVFTSIYERGHAMYRKCFNGTLSADSTTTRISLPDNAVLRNMYGNIYLKSSSLFLPLNYANPSATIYTYYDVANRDIVITAATTFKGCEYIVYAEYTIG